MKQLQTDRLDTGKSPARLLEVLSFIEVNLESEIAVHVLSVHAGMSESTLLRLFNKYLSQTPREYIRKKRLDKAKGLLVTGQFSVIEVGLMVGYTNPCSFSRAFFKEHGVPPSHLLP